MPPRRRAPGKLKQLLKRGRDILLSHASISVQCEHDDSAKISFTMFYIAVVFHLAAIGAAQPTDNVRIIGNSVKIRNVRRLSSFPKSATVSFSQ